MNDSEGAATAAPTTNGRTVEAAPGGSVPEQRTARPWRRLRSSGPPQLDFPPVENGLDYLVSVVNHLDEEEGGVTPRDVKYAVLHLQAAVEVLFKARLLAEHWTLVFTNPGEATRQALDDASLSSVTTAQAVTRLRNIVGVTISEKEEKALKKLAEDRNKLQHFGFSHNARAVEARAGEVLDFLIRFCDEQLVPCLTDKQQKLGVELVLSRLREALGTIESFVQKRMNRIGGELRREGIENHTIKCPDCEQLTLVLCEVPVGADPEDWADVATCRFCSRVWDTEELLGHFSSGTWDEPTEWNTCPQCERWSLGVDVRVRSDPANDVYFCFACATGFSTLVPCIRCSRPVDGGGGTAPVLCGLCEMDAKEERFTSRPLYESPADYGYTEERE